MKTLNVPGSQMTVDAEGVVTVESPELLYGLIHYNEEVLKGLEKELGIKASEITISKNGKLLFFNKKFAEKMMPFGGDPRPLPPDKDLSDRFRLNTSRSCFPIYVLVDVFKIRVGIKCGIDLGGFDHRVVINSKVF